MDAISAFILAVLVTAGSSTPTVHHNVQANELPTTPNSTMDYLQRAMNGLELALGFFQREYRVCNLDATIGTRLAEATLSVLLQRLDTSRLTNQIPASVLAHIHQLRDAAKQVSDRATPFIIENEPEYFATIGPIIAEDLFALKYDSRDVSQSTMLWRYNPREEVREEDSDTCLAEILGTRTGQRCSISPACWDLMTALGYNQYSLSHEIFYLEIAERMGCQKEMRRQMDRVGQTSLQQLHNVFCGNMLAEANWIADNGFNLRHQDLFMEQAALCGLLGYREFFSSEWLDQILSWQDKRDGCYRWAGWPMDKLADEYQQQQKRTKREEKRVSRGCLCHRTTVAASALAQYIRYILEVWLRDHM